MKRLALLPLAVALAALAGCAEIIFGTYTYWSPNDVALGPDGQVLLHLGRYGV